MRNLKRRFSSAAVNILRGAPLLLLLGGHAYCRDGFADLVIEAACSDLLATFLVYRDNRDPRLSDLFTVDAELILTQGSYKGREAIGERYDRPVPIHRQLLTTMRVTPIDEKTATSIAYVLLFVERTEFNGGPANPLEKVFAAAEYQNEYKLTDEGWKISRHRTVLVFKNFTAQPVES